MDAMTGTPTTPLGRHMRRLPWLLAVVLPMFCSCRGLPTASPRGASLAGPPSVAEQSSTAQSNTGQSNTEPSPVSTHPDHAPSAPAATIRPAGHALLPGDASGTPVQAGYLEPVGGGDSRAIQADYHQQLAARAATGVQQAGWNAPHGLPPGLPSPAPTRPHPGLPPQAYTTGGPHHAFGAFGNPAACCGGHGRCGQWHPPGLKQPWPEDEYLCDGGDRETQVRVGVDWSIRGLDKEDTVAHYDTRDGRTVVEPSNCVCIYAPRFASVRRVDGLMQHQQHRRAANVDVPIEAITSEERLNPTTVVQPLQPERHLALTPLDIFREGTRGLTVDMAEVPVTAKDAFLPHEDFLLIRKGIFDNTEKPRLTEHIDAALAWTDNKAVQVVIDDILATEAVGQNRLESVTTYELDGKPRLRICKVASTNAARPGDIVEFTLRFDNVGDQVIGNVTVIDHLTTRLEYVEGSQTSTLEADFFPIDDNDDSLVLRWEIKEPMKVGQGGLIRFKCRVR